MGVQMLQVEDQWGHVISGASLGFLDYLLSCRPIDGMPESLFWMMEHRRRTRR